MTSASNRPLKALALFVEAGLFALLAVAVGYGDFHHGVGFFILLFLPIAVGAVVAATLLPTGALAQLITHGALLTGCVIFAFPFLWLVSTSFKYDEEIFIYPPRWVPVVPPGVEHSPYVTTELLGDLPPEEATWDQAAWESAWPGMASYLWDRQGDRIRQLPGAADVPQQRLRAALLHGIIESGARRLPAAAWAEGPGVVIRQIDERVDDELLRTVWETVYRAVELREPTVQNIQRDYLPLPTGATPHVDAWQVLSGAAALGPTPTDEARPSRLLSYDFESSAADIVIRGSFPLPVPEDEFLGITLPLRQDRSWHALRVELEVGGRLYRSADDLFLDRYRWQEIGFKLVHLDERDERDLGIWPLVAAENEPDVFADAGRFRVTLRVEPSSRLVATWRKYTHHYRKAQLATEYWWRYVTNSVYLVLMTMLGQVLSCSIVAYAFSRLNWPGREALFALLLATMMLPPQVTMIPVFMIFEKLGWYNTLRALWAPSFFGSAFFIFLLRQFMKSIPNDLEDAAKIDGCSFFGIYWRIILPLVKPALAAVCIFTFMGTWNDFMGPLIYINDQRLYPLALGLFDFRGEHQTDFGMLMAASTMMTLPVIALFFLAQRYFIQGVTLTGIKG
jgi:ABC-type glycerol-3-phosphate transport system permease component